MELLGEIPDSDIDWDIRTIQAPLGRASVVEFPREESSREQDTPETQAPEETVNDLNRNVPPRKLATQRVPELDSLIVEDLGNETRSRFSRPGRANLTAYLAKDQRDHAQDLASQASSDYDFSSSEAELGLEEGDSELSSVPSSPTQSRHTDPFDLRQRQLVIDSDFSESEPELEIPSRDFDGVFQNRLTADLPASHMLGDSDYNQNSYSGLFDPEENEFSQSQSQPLSPPRSQGLYALEGHGGIDYMMQRPSRPRNKAQPKPLSVNNLLDHMGSRASNIVQIAARTARRRGGANQPDNPNRKLISGAGAGAQQVLNTWKDGSLDLRQRRTGKSRPVPGPLQEPLREPVREPGSMQAPRISSRAVSSRGPHHGSSRQGGSNERSREPTIRVPAGLRDELPEPAIPTLPRRRRKKPRKPSRPRRSEPVRNYHTTVLERDAKPHKRFKPADQKSIGPVTVESLRIEEEPNGRRLNDNVLLGLQKAQSWLAPARVKVAEIRGLRNDFGLDTFVGSIRADGGWELRSEQKIQADSIEPIMKGVVGLISSDVYNAFYDYFLERTESQTYNMDQWTGFLRIAVLEGSADSPNPIVASRLVVGTACLAATKGQDAVVNKLVMDLLFSSMNIIVLEQKHRDSRLLPGTELARLAAHFGIFHNGLGTVLGDSQRNYAARWQYVSLVATTTSYTSKFWDDVRLLTTPRALGDDADSARTAMDAYLKLITDHSWVPCPDVVIDCFTLFAKQQHYKDPEGELTELPSMIWRDKFNGRSRPKGDRLLFLEVLGSSLSMLSQQGDSIGCMRIVGRATPLSQFQFPETMPVQVADMSVVSQQYALLLVMIRESPPKVRPRVRQVRDLVNLQHAHVYIKAKALSAWQILVMISKDRPNDLIECHDWIVTMVKDAISDIFTEGKLASRAVIVQAARCCAFVVGRGISVVVPVVLFREMHKFSLQVRKEILKVATALATTGQVELLVHERAAIVDSLQTLEETAIWAQIAVVLYRTHGPDVLKWNHDDTRAAFYAAIVPSVGVNYRDIVFQTLDSSFKPTPTSLDEQLVNAATTKLSTDRPGLAKRLVAVAAGAPWGHELADELLTRLSGYVTGDTSYRNVATIRRLCFEAFPDLQKSHTWDSLHSYDDRVETVQGYLLRMLKGQTVMGQYSFFARRLKNALEECREDAFIDEMLDAMNMSTEEATIKAAVALLDVYAAFFEAAPWLPHKLEPALPLLARLANFVLRYSNSLEVVPLKFITQAVRYSNFQLHSSIDVDATDAGRALKVEMLRMGVTIMRQSVVAASLQKSVPSIAYGITALVFRYTHPDILERPKPLGDPPVEAMDIGTVFNSLRYTPPTTSMRAVGAALDDFLRAGRRFRLPPSVPQDDDFAWPDGKCNVFSGLLPRDLKST